MVMYLEDIESILGSIRRELERVIVSKECNVGLEYLGNVPLVRWVEADVGEDIVEGE